jgi:AbrB family looped-hinge helix DNA binding protein
MTQEKMMATLVSRIQERGQVTIPQEVREKLKLKKGDLVTFVETERGYVVQPVEVVIHAALDAIGDGLADKGVTLDQWIENGRRLRGQLLKEKYGLVAPDEE